MVFLNKLFDKNNQPMTKNACKLPTGQRIKSIQATNTKSQHLLLSIDSRFNLQKTLKPKMQTDDILTLIGNTMNKVEATVLH